nr:hypothetical protein [uncultured Dysosmobacter sp.]
MAEKRRGLFGAILGQPPHPQEAEHAQGPARVILAPLKDYPEEAHGFILVRVFRGVRIYPPWEDWRYFKPAAVVDHPALKTAPEPSNEYDKNAVALLWQGRRLGYLRRGPLQDMTNDWLRRGWPVFASFERGTKDYGNSEVYISLAFYLPEK